MCARRERGVALYDFGIRGRRLPEVQQKRRGTKVKRNVETSFGPFTLSAVLVLGRWSRFSRLISGATQNRHVPFVIHAVPIPF